MVAVAVVEGLFVVGGWDCAEASDSARCGAQPDRYPPRSIMKMASLLALIRHPMSRREKVREGVASAYYFLD